MSREYDPGRVVEYYTATINQIRLAMWALFAGVLLLAMAYERSEPVMAAPGIAAIVVFVVFLLRAARQGHPVLMLSPQGINYRGSGRGEVFVPWQVVAGVDTVDFTTGTGKRRVRHKDVTAVLVSEAFYRAHIHKDTLFARGPHWDQFYRPRGTLVEVAIHHDRFAIDPSDLRGQIEARWLAFRGSAPEPPPAIREHAFGRDGAPLVYRTGVFGSTWRFAGVLLPALGVLAVLARLAGVLPPQ